MLTFSGFTPKDFAAYERSKWESNAFNLERLEVKQKLAALGRELSPGLCAADGAPLELELSSEHPALWNHRRVSEQHLFFSRAKNARQELDGIISRKRTMASLIEDPSPLRNHIFLAVTIDAESVEIGLRLHSDAAVDRDNLLRKCADFFHRDKLLGLVRSLAPEFAAGLATRPLIAVKDLDAEMLAELIRELPGADTSLVVRRSFQASDPVLVTGEFVGVARSLMIDGLLPIWRHVAWSRDNDFVSMRDTLRDQEIQKKAKGLAKNDRVRVVQGVFSGKTGVVQSVDAKGALKVALGKMSVKLTGEDVVKI